MQALAARLGLKLSGAAFVGILVAVILALAGLGAWRAISLFQQEVELARAAAFRERDNYWRAEIEKSNASAERSRAEQAIEVAQREAVARAIINDLQESLKDMETKNAEMPDGPGGLKRDRVRLLPR